MNLIFRSLLLAAFAIWFGGFTFYVSFVVPVGTDVLGTAMEQGMITRRVTVYLNYIGILALVLMLVEPLVNGKLTQGRLGRTKTILSLLMAALLGLLFYLHPIMDRMIDPIGVSVTDEEHFYFLHRVYLWGSTVQWALCWAWLVVLLFSWQIPASDIKQGEQNNG